MTGFKLYLNIESMCIAHGDDNNFPIDNMFHCWNKWEIFKGGSSVSAAAVCFFELPETVIYTKRIPNCKNLFNNCTPRSLTKEKKKSEKEDRFFWASLNYL